MQDFHKQYPNVVFKYTHGQREDGIRYTVALAVNQDNRTVAIGLAAVNPKDNFCKRIGRDVASGRAKKRLYYAQPATAALQNVPATVRGWAENELKRLKLV